MRKLLIGCLILLTACQTGVQATVTEAPVSPTATLPAAPTPIAATFSPQPTPTLELSPTPLPRFFTHEFDASLAGWLILQAGSDAVPNIETENGSLILHMDSAYNWVYVFYGPYDYADVHIQAQFENRAGSPSSIGLICRYSEVDGWFEYNISTDGIYNVLYGRWLADGIADYLPILSGSSNAIGVSGMPQEAALICSGTILGLYINQQNIRNVDVSRYQLLEGKMGVTASSFENTPVIAAFDWVKVSQP